MTRWSQTVLIHYLPIVKVIEKLNLTSTFQFLAHTEVAPENTSDDRICHRI